MILKEVGGNPPDVTLDYIVKDLLSFFNGFQCLLEAKRKIEKKCDIKMEQEHYCWSEDYIKKAWTETIKKDIKSSTRRHWARVIVLQIVKHFVCDKSKQNTAQENRHTTTDNDELEMAEDVMGFKELSATKRKYSERGHSQTDSVSQDQSSTDVSASSETEAAAYKTIYIRIPLSGMVGNELPSSQPNADPNLESIYALTDGFPSNKEMIPQEKQIMKKKSYIMSYNKDKKNADWVYEILNVSTLPFTKKPAFKFDDFTDKKKQELRFKNKAYVRGHLAAAANHMWCQEACEDTYWMSNITPQNRFLNQGLWKILENYCRKLIHNNSVLNVHVYTGPLYLNDTSEDEGGKAVPSHYFKVVIVEKVDGKVELECYRMPNKQIEYKTKDKKYLTVKEKEELLKKYDANIEQIQTDSGLVFKDSSENKRGDDIIKTVTWTGNHEKKSVTTEVRISSPGGKVED